MDVFLCTFSIYLRVEVIFQIIHTLKCLQIVILIHKVLPQTNRNNIAEVQSNDSKIRRSYLDQLAISH